MRNLSRTRKSTRYNRSQKRRSSKSSTRRLYGGVWPFNLFFGKKQNVNPANTGIEMQTMASKNVSPLKNNSRKNNTITKTLTNTIFSSNNSSRPSIIPSIFPSSNNGARVNNDPISNLPHSPSAPPYSPSPQSPSAPPYSPLNKQTDPTAIYGTTDPEAPSNTPKSRRNRSNRSYRSRRSNRSNRSNRRN